MRTIDILLGPYECPPWLHELVGGFDFVNRLTIVFVVVVAVVVVEYLPPVSEHHRLTYVVEHIRISITTVVIRPNPTQLFTNERVTCFCQFKICV